MLPSLLLLIPRVNEGDRQTKRKKESMRENEGATEKQKCSSFGSVSFIEAEVNKNKKKHIKANDLRMRLVRQRDNLLSLQHSNQRECHETRPFKSQTLYVLLEADICLTHSISEAIKRRVGHGKGV